MHGLTQLCPKRKGFQATTRIGGHVDLQEKTSYVFPVTPSGLPEQSSSRAANDVLVAAADDAVTVTVAVADVLPVARAKRSSAVFALLASTPVPAARPMTAADKRAMIAHKMNTKILQPQSLPFLFPPETDESAPAADAE